MAERQSGMKSSMPPKRGQQSGGPAEGLGEALSGLTEALGGLAGGLGKTVGGVAKTATGALEGVLGNLLGPLQQLKQQAQGGSEEASQAYGQAVSMLRKSSEEGRTDARALLDQLGEALDQPSEGTERT
jgi:hypothetical protein